MSNVCNIPLALGLAFAVAILEAGAPGSLLAVRADDPPRRADRLKELQQEHLATLREALKLAEAAYRSGEGSYEKLHGAQRDVLQAELDQCETDRERIAVLEKLVVQAKEHEDRVSVAVKAATVPRGDLLRAKAARLHVEILLEKLKAKAPPGK